MEVIEASFQKIQEYIAIKLNITVIWCKSFEKIQEDHFYPLSFSIFVNTQTVDRKN